MNGILKDTFCIYCQVEFGDPAKLQKHVLSNHKGTYAEREIRQQRGAK